MFKRIPHIHKNRINVGRRKCHGTMLLLPFQFFYAVIYLQLEVGPIIIGLVIGGVAGLEDKCGDVVGLENMCGSIIKVDIMAVKEEDIWIDLARSIGPTEETR